MLAKSQDQGFSCTEVKKIRKRENEHREKQPCVYKFVQQIKAGPLPLETILVIFGRRAVIFLFESTWKNMKSDTTFVRMRSGDHLGDVKMSKKGTSLRRI